MICCRLQPLAKRTSSVLERLRDSARSARADDRREPTFPIGKAADLVGRTPAAIRDAEKDGRLPPPPRTENNRRVGYTLAQLNDMRGLFGTRPWRAPDDPCCVIAVQNFKGGVGKSTLSVHLGAVSCNPGIPRRFDRLRQSGVRDDPVWLCT